MSIIINGKTVIEIKINGKSVISLLDKETGKKVLLSKNEYTGSFVSDAKKNEFLAITDTVGNRQFEKNSLTSISIPNVKTINERGFGANAINTINVPNLTNIGIYAFEKNKIKELNSTSILTIGAGAFDNNELENINLPNATTIGNYAFYNNPNISSVNIPKVTTIGEIVFIEMTNNPSVTMHSKFNTNSEKDRIFGSGKWSNINFTWVDDNGDEVFVYDYVHTNGNAYSGTFSSDAKRDEFLAITDSVANNQFEYESEDIVAIRLPNVITIGDYAFNSSLEGKGFGVQLDFPETTTIGNYAFYTPVGYASLMNFPKATTIGDEAFNFHGQQGNREVKITLKSQFNTDAEKDRIFGADNWSNMTFTWV